MHLSAIMLAGAAFALSSAPAQAPQTSTQHSAHCRDTIELVRERLGKPKLDRQAARPAEAGKWLAVDRRFDNCRVLVPASDPSDIRPEPAPQSGDARLIPAR
jgi:hypothetical protein